jgi:hypothetical protein
MRAIWLKSKRRAAREKVQVKTPKAKRWKKIMALFDEGSACEYISSQLLSELGAEIEHEGTVTLHVKVLGEEYSWSFRVSDLNWEQLKVEMVFGQEFMKTQGVLLKGTKIEYAPGYPQAPVV